MYSDLESQQNGYRIIIIEDEESQIEIWKRILQEVTKDFPSMYVSPFKDAETAYKSILEDNHVSMVISDLHLSASGMNGYDLYKALRSKGKEFPFAIVSGDKIALNQIKERKLLTIEKPILDFIPLAQEISSIIQSNLETIFRGHVSDEIKHIKSSLKEVKHEQEHARKITEESLSLAKELKEELQRHTKKEEEFQKLITDKLVNKKEDEKKDSLLVGAGKFFRVFFSTK